METLEDFACTRRTPRREVQNMLGARRFVAACLACLMVFMLTAPALAQDAYTARLEGRAAGERHRTSAGIWSFTWSFLFGLIGAGGSVLYYATQTPEPDDLTLLDLANKSSEYRLMYLQAYEEAARKKQTTQAAVGAGLGLLSLILLNAAIGTAATGDTVHVPAIAVSW